MRHDDRHGRVLRADGDPRRRPADGFRTRDRRRFRALVHQGVAGLPPRLRAHAEAAEVVVLDVPGPDAVVDAVDGVVLAELDVGGPGRRGVLRIYRRPLEVRAERRADLVAAIDVALRHAVQDALGMPRDPED